MIAPASVIDITIRACEEEDVASITKIYAHQVPHGLASFEVEPPSETEMRQRCREVMGKGFPYLVAAYAGEIVGYAYASPYQLRPAYRYTAENSVYLHPAWSGRATAVAIGAACRMRDKRTPADRGGHWRQRQLRLDRAASASGLCDGRDHPVRGLQIRSLGR